MPGKAMVAATEATLMTTPPLPATPPGRMARKACLMPSEVPSRLTSSWLRTASGVEVDEQAGDLDARVVDQDVQAAELAGRVGDGACPAGVVGDVEVHEAVALAERLGHLGAEVVLDVGDDHLRAGGGEGLRHALAEALRPSGDEGLAPGEVENSHVRAPLSVCGLGRRRVAALGLTSVKTSLDTCQDNCWTPVKKPSP